MQKPLTNPAKNSQSTATRIFNPEYQEYDYVTRHSNRAGYTESMSLLLGDCYHEIQQRDDFGIVEINTPCGLARVQKTNLGYDVCVFIDGLPLPRGFFASTDTLDTIFSQVI